MFDHGAQYFRAKTEAFKTWLEPFRLAGHVQAWVGQAVSISGDGQVVPRIDDEERLVFTPAMNAIGKIWLAGRPNVKAYLDCQIEAIEGAAHDWHVRCGDERFGPFEAVIMAIPAPQVLAMLPENTEMSEKLADVKMIGCHKLMLGYTDGECDLPDWDSAHFNDDVLGFAAVNSRKPGRGGGDALVIQTNHQWSETHIETDLQEVTTQIKRRFSELTGLQTKATEYDRLHRWRYASTVNPLGLEFVYDGNMGLAAIGDWCLGSKVEDAFLSGWSLGINYI